MLSTILTYGVPIVAILAISQYTKIKKLYTALTFFNKSYIVDNFRSIRSLDWPYHTAHKGTVSPFDNTTGGSLPLSLKFNHGGRTYNLRNWLDSHWTTGLVVLKIESVTHAKLLFESYYLGNTQQTKTISWSLNKSVVSALIGIAIAEGKIKSVDDKVTHYVPQLINSAYEGVTILNVLQMSSGISFTEDYDKPFSDINRMCYFIALGWDLDNFIASLNRAHKPGTFHSYVSVDTQVLGMVLKGATGQSLTSYLEEKLWSKAGFEGDCDWLTDCKDMELAFGTLNACTRDYARFGWLYLNKGLSPVDGTRLIEEKWIEDSIKCTEPHLKPFWPNKFGYGYQWWLSGSEENPAEANRDYMAIGVYGQFIYIDPATQIVIARNSADPHYNEYEDANKQIVSELEALEAFRAIAKHFAEKI
jgi:CubicO group peptidase (beta-lactamase class C family)